MFVHKVRELYVLRLQSIRIEVITVPLGVHVHGDPELIRALCECAHNILRGNVQMTPQEKERLRKYQTKLRLLARKNVSVKQKRRHLQQTGGFLPALLAPLAASVVIPLLRQLFA